MPKGPRKKLPKRVIEEAHKLAEKMAKYKDKITEPYALAMYVTKKKHGLDPLKRKAVKSYRDYPVRGLIRLLELKDGSYFPEYALYGAKKAGLKKDHIVRERGFNLFVYK